MFWQLFGPGESGRRVLAIGGLVLLIALCAVVGALLAVSINSQSIGRSPGAPLVGSPSPIAPIPSAASTAR